MSMTNINDVKNAVNVNVTILLIVGVSANSGGRYSLFYV